MTDRYAVFGNPIHHSKSPAIHAAFAAQTGQTLSYQAILAPIDDFSGSVTAFFAAGGWAPMSLCLSRNKPFNSVMS